VWVVALNRFCVYELIEQSQITDRCRGKRAAKMAKTIDGLVSCLRDMMSVIIL